MLSWALKWNIGLSELFTISLVMHSVFNSEKSSFEEVEYMVGTLGHLSASYTHPQIGDGR